MAPRKNSTINSQVTGYTVTITVNNDDGSLDAQQEVLIVNCNLLSEEIREYALADRIRSKIIDAAAKSVDTDTGKSATAKTKLQAMQAVHSALLVGDWGRVKSGEAAPKGGLLLEALCRLFPGRTREELQSKINTWTPKQQTAMRTKDALVAPMVEKIRLEREQAQVAKSNIDTESLLADLSE